MLQDSDYTKISATACVQGRENLPLPPKVLLDGPYAAPAQHWNVRRLNQHSLNHFQTSIMPSNPIRSQGVEGLTWIGLMQAHPLQPFWLAIHILVINFVGPLDLSSMHPPRATGPAIFECEIFGTRTEHSEP